MATIANRTLGDETTNRSGKVRVLDSNTDLDEMNAGHIIPGANPPKNEHARGGFGDRDGRTGFGTDSADGPTALSTNEDSSDANYPTDGLASSTKSDTGTSTFALNEDDADDDDLTDVDTDDDFDDDDVDVSEIPDEDIDDVDLDDDFDDDADDLDLDDDADADTDDDDDRL